MMLTRTFVKHRRYDVMLKDNKLGEHTILYRYQYESLYACRCLHKCGCRCQYPPCGGRWRHRNRPRRNTVCVIPLQLILIIFFYIFYFSLNYLLHISSSSMLTPRSILSSPLLYPYLQKGLTHGRLSKTICWVNFFLFYSILHVLKQRDHNHQYQEKQEFYSFNNLKFQK